MFSVALQSRIQGISPLVILITGIQGRGVKIKDEELKNIVFDCRVEVSPGSMYAVAFIDKATGVGTAPIRIPSRKKAFPLQDIQCSSKSLNVKFDPIDLVVVVTKKRLILERKVIA